MTQVDWVKLKLQQGLKSEIFKGFHFYASVSEHGWPINGKKWFEIEKHLG